MNRIFGGRKIWFWRIAIIVLTLFILMRIYFRATDDFRLTNIKYEMPYHKEWEIAPLDQSENARLNAILDQKFHYIGKGAQSYVFGSDDGKYVIKFFKFKHLRPSWFIDALPDISPLKEYKENIAKRKARKLYGVFNGYKLAYDSDKENSGLIFIQLNPSNVHRDITLKDKLGFSRTVDLGDVVYVVQEKGVTLRNVLSQLLKEGDVATAKLRIGQIFNMYLSEYRKGILDHDHGVMQNAGFIGDRPIHLDIGKIHYDENISQPENYQKDLLKLAYKMQFWIKNNFPQYYEPLVNDIEQKLSNIFGYEVKIPLEKKE